MDSSATTHIITHRSTGTSAHVRLTDRLHSTLDAGGTPSFNDRSHIAQVFKHTQPYTGPDMSREFVDYADLVIAPDRRRHDFDEEPGPRLGPGGVILDADDEPEGCASCNEGNHARCNRCPLT